MEVCGPVSAQDLPHPVQHPDAGFQTIVRAKRAGVEVPKIDAGDQPFVQSAQLQHLVQIAELVDFSHGLRAEGNMPKSQAVADGNDLGQRFPGNVQRLPPGTLHQRPGVDNHPARPHPVRHLTTSDDIANGLFQGCLVRVGQIDKVRGVERQGNSRCPGVLPHLAGGFLSHVDALAALVLITVQAEIRNPLGRGQGGLVGLGKAIRISRRAKFRAHTNALLFPRRRNGVSMA